MTIAPQRVGTIPVARASGRRDTGIDLVRAFCVLAVVALHALMVGVTVTPDGPLFENASEGAWWIVPLSWALQVMPMFFVIGGFAGWTALRASRARGGTDASFIGARLQRLLVPALVTITVVGSALLVFTATGLAPELVGAAGYRFAQPLWFLGVFVFCQAVLPTLARAHERAPLFTIGALTLTATVVDVLRLTSGHDGLGFANLAFVWMALQQLGFFLADGSIDALARRTRRMIAVGAVIALALSMLFGVHSPDLIAHINPPTTALLLVGLAHTMLLSLARHRLTRWSERRIPGLAQALVNRRAMTIYLWHMPVLLTMAGALALVASATHTDLPAPSSVDWWTTRPMWITIALALTALIAMPLAKLESRRMPATTRSGRRLAFATAAGVAAIAVLLVIGTTPLTALVAAALIVTALLLARESERAELHTSK
jgi:peptidoglycan/LPS O-acetylase OafA/YrhL